MLRNLTTSKGFPLKPTRVCQYKIGPRQPDSSQIAKVVNNMMGDANMSNAELVTISNNRLMSQLTIAN